VDNTQDPQPSFNISDTSSDALRVLVEPNTAMDITIVSKPPTNNPSEALVPPVVLLTRHDPDANHTCTVAATATVTDAANFTAQMNLTNLHGEYFLFAQTPKFDGFFGVTVSNYKVSVPIVRFPAQGNLEFVDQNGNPSTQLTGFQPGKNLQVRYDPQRLLAQHPQCVQSDPGLHVDALAVIIMGVKLDGKDVPGAATQVAGVAEGDGTTPPPIYADVDLSSNPSSVGLFFSCRDARGNAFFDNNGTSGGFYSIPRAP
jgi:hypothetical protein